MNNVKINFHHITSVYKALFRKRWIKEEAFKCNKAIKIELNLIM